MDVLADNGRWVLAETDDRLWFIERRILPTWSAFVPGLLAVILVGNACVQAVVGPPVAVAAFAIAGAVFAVVTWVVLGVRRRSKARPLDQRAASIVLDLGQTTLCEGDGQVLARLGEATIARTMQATSSARALTISWPGGRRVVYRGDPFARQGSIGQVSSALEARGLTVAG